MEANFASTMPVAAKKGAPVANVPTASATAANLDVLLPYVLMDPKAGVRVAFGRYSMETYGSLVRDQFGMVKWALSNVSPASCDGLQELAAWLLQFFQYEDKQLRIRADALEAAMSMSSGSGFTKTPVTTPTRPKANLFAQTSPSAAGASSSGDPTPAQENLMLQATQCEELMLQVLRTEDNVLAATARSIAVGTPPHHQVLLKFLHHVRTLKIELLPDAESPEPEP